MDTASGLKVVSLPDGDVTISTILEPSWLQHNATGFTDPFNIAPDPDNVRLKLSPAKMAGLCASVKQYGVKQPLVITPLSLTPWVKVSPEHEDAFFLAVSGHRRREASIAENVGAVPYMVKVYSSEKDHRMDVSLYNKDNEDLTELEEGYEILRLQKCGWKIEELCKAFDCAVPQLYTRTYLTKLDKSLQALLDYELPQRQRLGSTLGGELGSIKEPTLKEVEEIYESLAKSLKQVPKESIIEQKILWKLNGDGLRFALQRALYAVIRLRNLSADRATQFIRERKLTLQSSGQYGGAPTERYQPRRRKEVIESLFSSFNGSVIIDWKQDDWRRVFELSTQQEVDAFLTKFLAMHTKLAGMISTLERIRSTKKAVSPEVLALMERNRNTQ